MTVSQERTKCSPALFYSCRSLLVIVQSMSGAHPSRTIDCSLQDNKELHPFLDKVEEQGHWRHGFSQHQEVVWMYTIKSMLDTATDFLVLIKKTLWGPKAWESYFIKEKMERGFGGWHRIQFTVLQQEWSVYLHNCQWLPQVWSQLSTWSIWEPSFVGSFKNSLEPHSRWCYAPCLDHTWSRQLRDCNRNFDRHKGLEEDGSVTLHNSCFLWGEGRRL